MMRNSVKMSRTVVPKNMDNGEIPKVSPRNFKVRLFKCEGGVDDDVDGN